MNNEELNKALQELYAQRSKDNGHAHKAHVNKLVNNITEQMVTRDIFNKNAELAAILAASNITAREKNATDTANLKKVEDLYGKRFQKNSAIPRAGEGAYISITSLIDFHIFTIVELRENLREFLAYEREQLNTFITNNPDIDLVLLADTLIILRRELDQNPELIALLRNLNSVEHSGDDTEAISFAKEKLSEIFSQDKGHIDVATQLLNSVSIEEILGVDITALEEHVKNVSDNTDPTIDLVSILSGDDDKNNKDNYPKGAEFNM